MIRIKELRLCSYGHKHFVDPSHHCCQPRGGAGTIIGICCHKGTASTVHCFCLDFALSAKIVYVFASGLKLGIFLLLIEREDRAVEHCPDVVTQGQYNIYQHGLKKMRSVSSL